MRLTGRSNPVIEELTPDRCAHSLSSSLDLLNPFLTRFSLHRVENKIDTINTDAWELCWNIILVVSRERGGGGDGSTGDSTFAWETEGVFLLIFLFFIYIFLIRISRCWPTGWLY